MKVLLCGGGTGGHIYPALAAVAELQAMGYGQEQFLWLGAAGEIEERLIPQAGLRLETLKGGPIVGISLRQRMVNLVKLTWSIGTAARLIGQFQPNVLLMTGGYINAPVALAAWLRRIPSLIYLPDVEPGAAIRLLSRLVDRIACTSPASRAYLPADKIEVTGYPVRPELRQARQLSRAEALARFEFAPGRPTLFVFGGSRGARSINRALLAILPRLLETVQVIHVAGTLDWPEVEAQARAMDESLRAYYRPYPYLHEEMGPAFRAADLVVARAGASMLGESPAFGAPAILVPYPYAWRYQKVNADYLVERGAAYRLDDERLPDELLPAILSLLQERNKLAEMAAAAAALDEPDAARKLARLIIKLGEGRKQ